MMRRGSVPLALLFVFLVSEPVLGAAFFSPSTGYVAMGAFKTESACNAPSVSRDDGFVMATTQGCFEFNDAMAFQFECSSGQPMMSIYSGSSCTSTTKTHTLKIPTGCHKTNQDLSITWNSTTEPLSPDSNTNFTILTGTLAAGDSMYLRAYCPSSIEEAVGSQAIYHYSQTGNATCDASMSQLKLYMAQSLTFIKEPRNSCQKIDTDLMTTFKNVMTAFTMSSIVFGAAPVSSAAQIALRGAVKTFTDMGNNGVKATMLSCNDENADQITASIVHFSDDTCTTMSTGDQQTNLTLALNTCTYEGCVDNGMGQNCGNTGAIKHQLKVTGVCSPTPAPAPSPSPSPSSSANALGETSAPNSSPSGNYVLFGLLGLAVLFVVFAIVAKVMKNDSDKDSDKDSDEEQNYSDQGSRKSQKEELEESDGSWYNMLNPFSSGDESRPEPRSAAVQTLQPELKLEESSKKGSKKAKPHQSNKARASKHHRAHSKKQPRG